MSDVDPRAEEWADEAEEDPWASVDLADDVNEADAAEQSIDVGLDDDEYR